MSEENKKDPTEEKLDKMFGRHKDGTPLKLELNPRSSVKKMFGIVSGKGGVGKSFVTASCAAEMQRRGKRTAILDGDICPRTLPAETAAEHRTQPDRARSPAANHYRASYWR